MSRHTTTGRWRLGLTLALTTMLAWATLPVALKLSLEFLDPWTLTWFRFVIAAALVLLWIGRSLGWRPLSTGRGGVWPLLLIAALGLIGNYVFYLLGLGRTGPAVAQIIIQLAPMLMGLGGIALFGERYSRAQWAGFSVLVLGLGLFFHHQLSVFSQRPDALWAGTLFLCLAAISWAGYALAQKQLLRDLSSPRIMLFIYLFASITLAPLSQPQLLGQLNSLQWALLIYCALNTLIAYGAFAEALNHWEASRVSAVLALTPLGTFLVAMLVSQAYPQLLAPEPLDALSWFGALVVVSGSITTSLAGRRRSSPDASSKPPSVHNGLSQEPGEPNEAPPSKHDK